MDTQQEILQCLQVLSERDQQLVLHYARLLGKEGFDHGTANMLRKVPEFYEFVLTTWKEHECTTRARQKRRGLS